TPIAISQVDRCSIVAVRLFTGRRHQARRHLKHIAHPIIGDANHGKGPINRAYREAYGLSRMALHARSVIVLASNSRFASEHATNVRAPSGVARFSAVAPLPADLRAPLLRLFDREVVDALDALDATEASDAIEAVVARKSE